MASTRKRNGSTAPGKPVPTDGAHLKPLTGTESGDFSFALLNQVLGTLWYGSECPVDLKGRLVQFGLGALREIGPRDGVEGLLAAQMVAVHSAAQECFCRAAIPEQTFVGRDMALRHGTRLARLYVDQMAALRKYRGKGQQKVTVKHVHVHDGGQAIVGQVTRGDREASKPEEQPHAKPLAHAPEPTLRCPDEEEASVPLTSDVKR